MRYGQTDDISYPGGEQARGRTSQRAKEPRDEPAKGRKSQTLALRPIGRRWSPFPKVLSQTPVFTLRDHGYGASVSRCVPVYVQAVKPVPNYTAWWQRYMCENNLPKVVTRQRPGEELNLRLWVTSELEVRHVTVRLPSLKSKGLQVICKWSKQKKWFPFDPVKNCVIFKNIFQHFSCPRIFKKKSKTFQDFPRDVVTLIIMWLL